MRTSARALTVERLKTTARDLVSLVGAADPGRLNREPAPDEWSAAVVVAHLADTEAVYGLRLRRMLTEDRPVLDAFDEQVWATRFSPLEPAVRETLQRWRSQREATTRILDSLSDDEWQLVGVHSQRGRLTVAAMADYLVAHDRDHLDQIRRALAR